MNKLNKLFNTDIKAVSSSELNLPLRCDLKILELCIDSYIQNNFDLKKPLTIDMKSTEKNIMTLEFQGTNLKGPQNPEHLYMRKMQAQLLDTLQKNQFLSIDQNATISRLIINWVV